MESLTIASREDIALDFRIDKRAILYELENAIRQFNQENVQKIKLGCRSLAQELVRLASDQWNSNKNASTHKPLTVETYTKSLAKVLGCSDRTVRNYYVKLTNAGIIETRENVGGQVVLLLSHKLLDSLSRLRERKKMPSLVLEPQEHFTLNNPAPKGQGDKIVNIVQEHFPSGNGTPFQNSSPQPQGKEYFSSEQEALGEKCWKAIHDKIYSGIYDFGQKNRNWGHVCAELIAFEAQRTGKSFHESYFELQRRICLAAEWLAKKPELTPPPPSYYLACIDDGKFRLTSVRKWETSLRTMKYATKARFKILNMAKVFRKGKSRYSMAELNRIFIKEVEIYPILKPWYLGNVFHLLTDGHVLSRN